jgi:hypothetical protein
VFVLDGKPLALDVPFEANGTLYPANWLRLAGPSDREAIGITEVPDPPVYDQRFYWGYTASGTLIPKDHGTLVSGWVDQTRQTANTLLFPTDWMVVREADNGTPMSSGVKNWRQELRTSCEGKVVQIRQTTTTDELAAYITGSGYPMWPPLNPPTPPDPSGVVILDQTILESGVTQAPLIIG